MLRSLWLVQWYFRYWLGRISSDDERQTNRWKGIILRFEGKLIKMTKNVNGKFNDYFILPIVRQILLHRGYELTEKDFLPTQQINLKRFFSLVQNMSYYHFNKKNKSYKMKQ